MDNMPIIISQIKTPIESAKEDIIKIALRRLDVREDETVKAEVHKISLDARKQNDIKFVSSVYVSLKSSELLI